MTFAWKPIKEYSDIRFELFEGIAKITINRPEVRNAFSPVTVAQMGEAFAICREREDISVVVLTGEGDKAFCSGGDMHFKGRGGYVGPDGVPRLNVLDVQKQIRSLPKPVIAMVNGYAIGGGNVLATVCDLTIASENAIFGQTGPKVGSFDAGLARPTSPASWVRRRRAKSGSSAVSTARRKRSKWGSRTPWCRSISLRKRLSNGQSRCSSTARSRSGS